jgi:hypothetical protein
MTDSEIAADIEIGHRVVHQMVGRLGYHTAGASWVAGFLTEEYKQSVNKMFPHSFWNGVLSKVITF